MKYIHSSFKIAFIIIVLTMLAMLLYRPQYAEAPASSLLPIEVAHAETITTSSDWPPDLKRICSCESWGVPDEEPRQYEKDGVTVLLGRVNPNDIGMCQLNKQAWGAKSVELGFDIYTSAGNKLMAEWIYAEHGAEPWKYSRSCHGLH